MTNASLFLFGLATAAIVAVLVYGALRRRMLAQSSQLAEANRRFQATFDSAAVGIAHLDLHGHWLRVNDRFCEIAGRDRSLLLGRPFHEIVHGDDVPLAAAAFSRLLAGEAGHVSVEQRYLAADGRETWANVSRSIVRDAAGRPDFFMSVIEDISPRKLAEAQVTTGEAQYRATFDSAVEAMAVIDARGTIQSVNPALVETFGYKSDELIGENIKMLMPKSIARQHDGYLRRYRDTGVKAIIGIGREVVGRRKDGSEFPLDLSVAEWERDGAAFFTGVMRDVSARKAAEAALVAGEAQYRAIFDSAVEAMAVIDAKGTVQSVNPALVETFGYRPDELVGKNIKMLMPQSIASHHDGYLRRYRDTGIKAIIGTGREVTGRRSDGSEFPLDLSVAEWERDGATFFTGVMRDVSARKDAETSLRAREDELRVLQGEFAHFARVNDLGEMAAAIAHEINQPLTAIVNYLNSGLFIATEGYSEDGFGEAEQVMRQASEQALRAGDIVRRLREFIGHGNSIRSVEHADTLVDAAMALALIDARSGGIAVERLAGAGDAEVEVDAVQIQQVLVNLLRNAVEAMAGPGTPESGPRLMVATSRRGDMIEIEVEDNGPGITPDVLDRLFEPFVTTKAKGMGMGLSVCRRLIEAHGGAIEATSVPGGGATFRFTLPRFGSD